MQLKEMRHVLKELIRNRSSLAQLWPENIFSLYPQGPAQAGFRVSATRAWAVLPLSPLNIQIKGYIERKLSHNEKLRDTILLHLSVLMVVRNSKAAVPA